MKKILRSVIVGVIVIVSSFGFSLPALANTPMLSANYQGGGSNVQITITNADAYASVSLYTRQSSMLWTAINNIGQTDASGYFSQVVNMTSDGSGSPIQVYALVNTQQSATVSLYPNGYSGGGVGGCGYYGCNSGNLNLSQNYVSLNIGQSTSINVTGGLNYNSFYISSNSNPSVVDAITYSTSVQLTGRTNGSSTVMVCNGGNCGSIYVTVSGSNTGYGSLSLSQTSLSVATGQTSTVTINGNSGYGGNYYVSYNTNSSIATATISGNSIK